MREWPSEPGAGWSSPPSGGTGGGGGSALVVLVVAKGSDGGPPWLKGMYELVAASGGVTAVAPRAASEEAEQAEAEAEAEAAAALEWPSGALAVVGKPACSQGGFCVVPLLASPDAAAVCLEDPLWIRRVLDCSLDPPFCS